MKTQIYLLITLVFLISLTSCVVTRLANVDEPVPVGINIATLQAIIESGNLSAVATSTDSLVTNTLTYLTTKEKYTTDTEIKAIYATESGAGDFSGSSWANAVAATALRKAINDISDASPTNVYAVLVASGTYKPVDISASATIAQRGPSFTIKNHVAIIGGFTNTGGWGRGGTTTFSGDIGAKDNTGDNSYHVFSHNSIPLDNGLLYGATITKANANGVSPKNRGGGMYNVGSSPRLVNVVFVSNSASFDGGGMYNNASSSPVLTGVKFTDNSVSGEGGGMYNNASSSPVLTGVEFTGNSASQGGGMYNSGSSPVLTRVVFTNNSANNSGGGIYNDGSSAVLAEVVFTGNNANDRGGGMYNVNTGSSPVLVGAVFRGNNARNNGGGLYSFSVTSGDGPVIVNSIFTANSVTSGVGKDIALDRNFLGNNIKVRVAGSVLGIGTVNATNGIVVANTGGTVGSYNITYHSLANGVVKFGADATTSASAGGLAYPTIQDGSSALNIGLHVRKSGNNYYFSEDGTTWYTDFTDTGDFSTAVALPDGAEDLTATDIAGNTMNGRPDAGVHEYR